MAMVLVKSVVFVPVMYERGCLHGMGPLEKVFFLYLHEDFFSREVEGGVGVESSTRCSGSGGTPLAVGIFIVVGSLGTLSPVAFLF